MGLTVSGRTKVRLLRKSNVAYSTVTAVCVLLAMMVAARSKCLVMILPQ